MIELHALGDAVVRIGDKEVRPSSPMVFAALVYLCAARGRRVPRAELQALLFGTADESKSSHSLRQLLYKLKQAGVPITSDNAFVCLPGSAARVVTTGRADFGIFPQYSGNVSPEFAEWLEAFRTRFAAELRSDLLKALAAARLDGNAEQTLSVATRLLAIDPLNEEAVLSRAEALALLGQKADAVRGLEEYSSEVAGLSPHLRLSADVLRKRISERTPPPPKIPLLGRSIELAELLALFRTAEAGQTTMAVIWGDAGIGKTRLVHELRVHLALKAALVVAAQVRPHDVARPMGPLLDLVPQLLRARGALGISPESNTILRSVAGADTAHRPSEAADFVAARLRAALEDLISCVAAESPMAILIEDAQWLDQPSESFLAGLKGLPCRIMVVLTYRKEALPPAILSSATHVRRLGPLPPAAARELLALSVGGDTFADGEIIDRCIALASGNALFLCTIGEHFRRSGGDLSSEATLQDLLRARISALSPIALLVIRSVVAMGIHGTHERLERCLALRAGDILLALQELTDRGLVIHANDTIQCSHDMLADVVIGDTPRAIFTGVMTCAARVLEDDGAKLKQPSLLWSCAECWSVAASQERAATALRQCAALSVNVGQPRFAIEALEKAQSFVPDQDLGDWIEDTIRLADDSWAPDAVFRNVNRIRAWRTSRARDPFGSTIAEVARLNAARREEQPIWDERELIERCANNPDAPVADRLRAGRIFLLAAEEQLDIPAANAMHDVMQQLMVLAPAGTWSQYLVTYHSTFGSLGEGAAVARTILARRSSAHQPFMSAVSQAAFALYRSGEVQPACDVYREYVELARKARLHRTTVANYATALATILIQIGDCKQGEHFTALAFESLAATGRKHSGALLTCLLELALARGDIEEASKVQRQLRSEFTAMLTPNRERIAVGNDLVLLVARGEPVSDSLLLKAETLFVAGAVVSEADTLAHGIAAAYASRGARLVASEFLNDYLTSKRRDRYPLSVAFQRFISAQSAQPSVHEARPVSVGAA